MEQSKVIRHVYYYEDHYEKFFLQLAPQVQKKFNWVLQLVSTLPIVPEKFFKHISGTDGLYEVRVEVASNIYRIFSFFDEGKVIILLNAFQKKTMRLPVQELETAKKLKKKYFSEKNNQKKSEA